jgi:hypothetical protein
LIRHAFPFAFRHAHSDTPRRTPEKPQKSAISAHRLVERDPVDRRPVDQAADAHPAPKLSPTTPTNQARMRPPGDRARRSRISTQ